MEEEVKPTSKQLLSSLVKRNICALVTLCFYVIFMLVKCYKCSHICYSLYKMQMHHLPRRSPPRLSRVLFADLYPWENWQIGTFLPLRGPYGSVHVCVRSSLSLRCNLWRDEALPCSRILSVHLTQVFPSLIWPEPSFHWTNRSADVTLTR